MRNYKENCPSLWNDMKNEWYSEDDMKDENDMCIDYKA